MKRLVEAASSQLEIGIPAARRVVCVGNELEVMETVAPLAVHDSLIELAARGIDLHGHGVILRELVLQVIHDKCQVQGVARPPYATFAIDIALQAAADGLAAYVEAAGAVLVSVLHLQVAGGLAAASRHCPDLAVRIDGRASVPVGPGTAYALLLEVVGIDLRTAQRLSAEYVIDGHPYAFPVLAFCDDANVAAEQGCLRETGGVHIEGILRRVIPVFPLIFAPVTEILVVPAPRAIPHSLVGFAQSIVRIQAYHCVRSVRLRFSLRSVLAVEGIFLAETQPDHVYGPRLLLHHSGEVQLEEILSVQVQRRVAVQSDFAAVNEPAAASHHFVAVEPVVLQEAEYIVFIYPYYAQVYRIQLSGTEADGEVRRVGEYIAFPAQCDGRPVLFPVEAKFNVRCQPPARFAANGG